MPMSLQYTAPYWLKLSGSACRWSVYHIRQAMKRVWQQEPRKWSYRAVWCSCDLRLPLRTLTSILPLLPHSLSLSLSLSLWMCVGCWWWWWHSASFSSLEMMTMRRKIHGVSKNAPASASNCVLMCCIYLIFLFVYFSAVLCVCVVFLWALVAWNKNKMKWLREIKCLFIHSFIHSFKL